MLTLKNVNVSIDKKLIINNLNLTVNPGEITAMMGPNGSGKSTLAYAIIGMPELSVEGNLSYLNHNLIELSADERAKLGIFLCFQNPVPLPGVRIATFLRASMNYCRSPETPFMDSADFVDWIQPKLDELELTPEFLDRNVNEDLSGGEKKRLELLQILCLNPSLCILDEPDSGLDVDGVRLMEKLLLKRRLNQQSTLVISHYGHFLTNLKPEHVHVLVKGQLILSGDTALAVKIQQEGYQWL